MKSYKHGDNGAGMERSQMRIGKKNRESKRNRNKFELSRLKYGVLRRSGSARTFTPVDYPGLLGTSSVH